jgi:hypothetical protein
MDPARPPKDVPPEELASAMHDHLRATEELPIDPTANRWLGEAQAAASDVATGEYPDAVLLKRAEQVQRLLESAGDLQHSEAREHVETAHTMATELVERLSETE